MLSISRPSQRGSDFGRQKTDAGRGVRRRLGQTDSRGPRPRVPSGLLGGAVGSCVAVGGEQVEEGLGRALYVGLLGEADEFLAARALTL